MHSSFRDTRGFTLVELLIVVAVIAILVAIAYPSYRDSVQKGRRAAVKSEIVELGQTFERCFTNNNTYQNCFASNALPGALNSSPRGSTGADRFYSVAIDVPNATSWTVTATALNDQSDDRCGNLSLNQAGVRTESGSATLQDCW